MTPDPVHRVLRELNSEALQELIGEDRLSMVESVVGKGHAASTGDDRSKFATLLAVLHGQQLLEDPRLRSRLLMLLSPTELERFAVEYAGKSFDKPADNVLALAALPWRAGTPFPLEFVKRFELPVVYLPRTTATAPSTYLVTPFEARRPLRDYQREVKDRVLELVKGGASRILVQMPTGAGKTRTMMDTLVEIARAHGLFAQGKSILWLAHVEELCEQAVDAFEESWTEGGDAPVTVVRAWGNNKPNVSDYAGAFIVGTYQKMVALRKNAAEFEQIRHPIKAVVTDEAHKVVAPTFASLLNDLAMDEVVLIGLTATPGRGLNLGPENVQLASFFDKNLVGPTWSKNPIRELREKGVLARIRHRTIESEVGVALTAAERAVALETDLPGSVLNRLAASAQRNRRIVDAIRKEIAEGRPCLVFACSVEHSLMLTAILNIEGARAAHIDSTVSRAQRRHIVASFRAGSLDAVLNFGVLSTGFDAPRVSAVVIARPTTSVVLYSQMVGRGLRGPASGGNEECNLIDVRDNFTSFGAVDDVYQTFAPYWE